MNTNPENHLNIHETNNLLQPIIKAKHQAELYYNGAKAAMETSADGLARCQYAKDMMNYANIFDILQNALNQAEGKQV